MTDFFRVQLGIVGRGDGHSAAKRAAYQSCGKIVDHEGLAFDFSRKASEHVRSFILTLPGAPAWAREPESLWQRAAAVEKRVDAQEARIIDFSMPRAVPAELWEACIRQVYEPFVDMGMVLQIDIHDTPASDGGRNINVHGLSTLREIDGGGFASRKNRGWNDHFRERNGRAIREQFAERLTNFCRGHGLDYQGDARPNAERDLPDPEPNLPRWNFEAFGRTGEMPEAMAALQDHRARRQAWEAARAEEVEAALDLARIDAHVRERRRRGLSPAGSAGAQVARRDRRAAILRAWHDGGWIDAADVAAIASTRFDDARSCLWIDLKDGGTLIDRGDFIALRGRLTWTAAMETAAAAERHGWTEVHVFGDQAYKDAVSVAAMLRGLKVLNHELSPKARAELKRLITEQVARQGEQTVARSPRELFEHAEGRLRNISSRELHRRFTKRSVVQESPPIADADGGSPASVLKPRFRKRLHPKGADRRL
ncbi:MobA/MobL family protein [Mesorhizobium sp. BR-1-1-8]|uniref:MobA/MobL family protein n=1 Tax=Mesorhizobium sp. BR-1-1-8 TaxID=2876659 RepID=UPI001CCA6142|nr:MobA/MobL family protein [Mesorhizobium sp. BR-1-1-8]MBZ9983984.1 MobA/MobL family protein [Mesorhizobium sp. BR-1-1-8]